MDSLKEMDKFLETYNLPRLNQEEIENINRSINGNEIELVILKTDNKGFPGGAVVKNPPANAGDMGLSSGPGRSHMPQSN